MTDPEPRPFLGTTPRFASHSSSFWLLGLGVFLVERSGCRPLSRQRRHRRRRAAARAAPEALANADASERPRSRSSMPSCRTTCVRRSSTAKRSGSASIATTRSSDRRLAQKMGFLLDDTAEIGEPSDSAAAGLLRGTSQRAIPRTSPHFLSSRLRRVASGQDERRRRDATSPTPHSVRRIATGAASATPSCCSGSTPSAPTPSSPSSSAATFVDSLSERATRCEWSGPLESAYGHHAVHVVARRKSPTTLASQAVEAPGCVTTSSSTSAGRSHRRCLRQDPSRPTRWSTKRVRRARSLDVSRRCSSTPWPSAVLALPAACSAHEVRPAYLELREGDSGLRSRSPSSSRSTPRPPASSGPRTRARLQRRRVSVASKTRGLLSSSGGHGSAIRERRRAPCLLGRRVPGERTRPYADRRPAHRSALRRHRNDDAAARQGRALPHLERGRGRRSAPTWSWASSTCSSASITSCSSIAMVLYVRRPWQIVKVVTAFTVAHSLTLALSTLGVVRTEAGSRRGGHRAEHPLPRRRVGEAREARRSPITTRRPWLVAFGFGLLHGFGFAGALAEIGLPRDAAALALFLFNVGVEIGQLLIVAGAPGRRRAAGTLTRPSCRTLADSSYPAWVLGTTLRALVPRALLRALRRLRLRWPAPSRQSAIDAAAADRPRPRQRSRPRSSPAWRARRHRAGPGRSCKTAMIRTPRNVADRTDPRPPIRLVPPMTTAAIAESSRPDRSVRIGRLEIGGVQRPGEPRQSTAESEGPHLEAPRVDADQLESLLVGAESDELATEDRARQQESDSRSPTNTREHAGSPTAPRPGSGRAKRPHPAAEILGLRRRHHVGQASGDLEHAEASR